MNNEPVAWTVNDKFYKDIFDAEHYSKFTNKPIIPLYTHPAKTLTDEEIKDVGYQYCEFGLNLPMIRAILRKAQE